MITLHMYIPLMWETFNLIYKDGWIDEIALRVFNMFNIRILNNWMPKTASKNDKKNNKADEHVLTRARAEIGVTKEKKTYTELTQSQGLGFSKQTLYHVSKEVTLVES